MARNGRLVKKRWTSTVSEMFDKLTFRELKEGNRFISFPLPGDNRGHGGFRGTNYIFQKLSMSEGSHGENSVRLIDGTLSRMPDGMLVLKVE